MTEQRKYELMNERDRFGHYRIRALRDFGYVMAGELGGFVESGWNLSHYGECWIFDEAAVFGNAQVFENARVCGKARVYGNAKIFGKARVDHSASISGNAEVSENACVFGQANVYGNSKISGYADVSGRAQVCGTAVLKNQDEILSGILMIEADGFVSTRDSRRYTFLAAWNKDGKIVSITAGCRNWNSMEEAREHYLIDYGSDGNVRECLGILEYFAKIASLKSRKFFDKSKNKA